jgi:butyryl-CoA dehydrogenase
VAIDFRLAARQRELQFQSRKFAREVLSPALKAEALPTPEERFAATKPAYEAIVAAGFLRKCIPLSAGERTLVSPTLRSWSRNSTR